MGTRDIIKKILSEETFNSLFKKKNTWVKLTNSEKKELSDNLWKLVSDAYDTRFEGGHPRIKSPNDVANDPDLTFWKAADIDDDPLADVLIFGRETPYGIKISGIGHDNQMLSKKEVMKQSANILRQPGFWIEVSDNVAMVLIGGYHVPVVKNADQVEKILNTKIDKWLGVDPDGRYPGNGWYLRDVSRGKISKKCILGNPRI